MLLLHGICTILLVVLQGLLYTRRACRRQSKKAFPWGKVTPTGRMREIRAADCHLTISLIDLVGRGLAATRTAVEVETKSSCAHTCTGRVHKTMDSPFAVPGRNFA